METMTIEAPETADVGAEQTVLPMDAAKPRARGAVETVQRSHDSIQRIKAPQDPITEKPQGPITMEKLSAMTLVQIAAVVQDGHRRILVRNELISRHEAMPETKDATPEQRETRARIFEILGLKDFAEAARAYVAPDADADARDDAAKTEAA